MFHRFCPVRGVMRTVSVMPRGGPWEDFSEPKGFTFNNLPLQSMASILVTPLIFTYKSASDVDYIS